MCRRVHIVHLLVSHPVSNDPMIFAEVLGGFEN
jgi:hypothetical protein